MRISIINNIWSRVDLDDLDELRQFLSYEDYYWKPMPFGKVKEVYQKTFVGKTGFFLTGLLPLVEDKYPIQYKDTRPALKYVIKRGISLAGVELRGYQLDLIGKAVFEQRGVLKAPTGSGKTVIAAGIIKSIEPCTCLFIVHTKSLLTQTIQSFEKLLGEKIGLIASKKFDIQRVTVAMIQTLARMEKNELKIMSGNFSMIIVDEAHHAQSKSYNYVLNKLDAPFRFGLSATPKDFEDQHGEYMKVIAILGPIIHEIGYSDISSVMAVPRLRMLSYGDCPRLSLLHWKESYYEGIVNNPARNNKIKQVVLDKPHKSILILVKHIEHGEILQDLIPNSTFVNGRDEKEVRDMVKNLLNLKKINVVISTSVFGEGVDIPELEIVINAAAGLSKISTIQKAGRVLRKTKTKTEGFIIDFWDPDNRYLYKHSLQRWKTYNQLGFICQEGTKK